MWNKIEQAMMRQGIKPSCKNFRKITGLSTFTISKIRKNQRNINLETLDIIACKLDTTVINILSE